MKMAVATTENNISVEKSVFGENLVGRFIKFAGVAEKSAATYITALRQMFKYFRGNEIVNPSRADLENWRDSLI